MCLLRLVHVPSSMWKRRTIHSKSGIFAELLFASVTKPVLGRNQSYENVFPLEVHFHANQTHFHMKGFARILVLEQRLKVTRKWPIVAGIVIIP